MILIKLMNLLFGFRIGRIEDIPGGKELVVLWVNSSC